ncbi:MAG: DUF2520 domain-containing protein [Phycisphaerales bacterium]|nr:DUF2520 domain-containing protein [Phycisphaerales bacterium]|tara:strand:- start:2757 stop:3803 length:1047 start_codon:yes stop_codon:yes gene_type:complete
MAMRDKRRLVWSTRYSIHRDPVRVVEPDGLAQIGFWRTCSAILAYWLDSAINLSDASLQMIDQKTSISIVGAGALGQALALGIHRAGRNIETIVSRSRERGGQLAEAVEAELLPSCQGHSPRIVILCVPDDVISATAGELDCSPDSIVVHCAGSRGLDVLESCTSENVHTGSIHPVMVLARGGRGPEAMHGATAAIEGDHVSEPWLHQLACDLGMRPVCIPPERRALYHLSAALVGGLMTGLLAASADLWKLLELDRSTAVEALAPMVREAGLNFQKLGVPDVVMGPAARGDIGTIRMHLNELRTHAPHLLPLYRELALLSIPYAVERSQLDEQSAKDVRRALEFNED